MSKTEMRDCPFCNAKISSEFPDMMFVEGLKKYVFTHACNYVNGAHTVFVSIYGDTEEEAINKWNGIIPE